MANKEFINGWVEEWLAMLMVGEACVTLVDPEGHVRLYMRGPKKWQRFLNVFIEHPCMTRGLAIAELAAGVWLAKRQYDKH